MRPPPDVMAWEERARGVFARLFATLRATFEPVRTVQAVSVGPLAPALVFSWLTMIPSMILSGIIPYTHTLVFGDGFGVNVRGGPSEHAIWMDVAQAAGLGLGLGLITWLSWALPFASLTGAFAAEPHRGPEAKRAAWRSALYHGWIAPFSFLVFHLFMWGLPKGTPVDIMLFTLLATQVGAEMLLLLHRTTLARHLGASYWGALGVSLIPLAVALSAGQLLGAGLGNVLPTPSEAAP